MHKKPKPNFSKLVPQFVPYKPTFIGHVLFNGKLLKANANYSCFMTFNITKPSAVDIPHNLRVCFVVLKVKLNYRIPFLLENTKLRPS